MPLMQRLLNVHWSARYATRLHVLVWLQCLPAKRKKKTARNNQRGSSKDIAGAAMWSGSVLASFHVHQLFQPGSHKKAQPTLAHTGPAGVVP